jgi:hypothetical protein
VVEQSSGVADVGKLFEIGADAGPRYASSKTAVEDGLQEIADMQINIQSQSQKPGQGWGGVDEGSARA